MNPTRTIAAFAVVLAAAAVPSSASSQNAAPQSLQLNLHANFIGEYGDWSSSGAFTDEGIIAEVLEHQSKGNLLHAANLHVIETLSGNDGTFTWEFTRHFAPVAGPTAGQPTYNTGGAWQIISGTGAYSGISGQGTFTGTINFDTGDIYDTFEGHVQLAL